MLMTPRARGFSLTELMVTLLVAAILVAFGVPSLRKMLSDNQAETKARQLAADLRLARSEAIKRNETVTVCASGDGESCGGTWGQGWIVLAETEPKLIAAATVPASAGLDVAGGESIAFDGEGTRSSGADVFKFATSNEDSRAIEVEIYVSGTVRVGKSEEKK